MTVPNDEQNPYETDKLLGEYLLFHYGSAEQILPYGFGPREALHFSKRVIDECIDSSLLPETSRALDLGCAVGRASFELSKICSEVVGVDYSSSFIRAAKNIQEQGSITATCAVEGIVSRDLQLSLPEGVFPQRISFETGDAMKLRKDIGQYDVVVLSNLVDRLRDPLACLNQLSAITKSNAQLIIVSPYTWLEEYTPQNNWLGGRLSNERELHTLDSLTQALQKSFSLSNVKDIPFLIKEHSRKYQWSVAQATIWRARQ